MKCQFVRHFLLITVLFFSVQTLGKCPVGVSGFSEPACAFLGQLGQLPGIKVDEKSIQERLNHICPWALKNTIDSYDITYLYTFNFIYEGQMKQGRFIVQNQQWNADSMGVNGTTITDVFLDNIPLKPQETSFLESPTELYKFATFKHVNFNKSKGISLKKMLEDIF